MVAPEPGGRGDAVEQRHVQVEHAGVGLERLGVLDRREAVGDRANDLELGLVVDQHRNDAR